MNIIILRRAQKQLEKMEAKTKTRIIDGLHGLREIPPVGEIERIKGKNHEYRLRIGRYRILFTFDNTKITIYDIGSRGDIYK